MCLGLPRLLEARFPSVELRVTWHLGHCICVLAAVPSQGELGGRKPPPPEPDPAVEPAEPDASGAEHGEQGAVPRGAEAVHVRGVGGACPQGSRLPGSTPRWETSGPLGARGQSILPAYPSLGFSGSNLDF